MSMNLRIIGNYAKIITLSAAISCFILGWFFSIQAKKEKEFLKGVAICFKDRSFPLFLDSANQDEAKILAMMHSLHQSMRLRQAHIGTVTLGNPSSFFRWVSEDLNDAGGACGGYSKVLGRLLIEMGYDVRKVGLNDDRTGETVHHVVEVKLWDRWVLLDPWFNLYFRRPDGTIAGAIDLADNWQFFRMQVPVNYPMNYNYKAYHYTNWKRLGFLGRLIEKVIDSNDPSHKFSAFKYIVEKDQYLPSIAGISGIVMLLISFSVHCFQKR